MAATKKKDYLDLIFESRNKAYGAYQLRRRATLFASLSFLFSLVLIVGLFALGKWMVTPSRDTVSDQTRKVHHRKVVGYSQLSAPPPIETVPTPSEGKQQPRGVKQKQVATKKFLPPVVKPDAEVEEEEIIPTQKELKKVNPGKETVEGDTIGEHDLRELEDAVIEMDIEMETRPEEEAPPPPPPPKPEPPPEEEPEEVYQFVEVAPSFPGGNKALRQFLREHLKYPEMARNNNIEGTVVVEMVIEADGSISDIRVLRGLGGGCTDEVIRIINLMPKWNPGVQAGRKVPVWVALPVKFELEIH